MAKIGFIVGSLKETSFNKKLALQMIDLLPSGFSGEIVEIGKLPFYIEDYDGNEPVEYKNYREKLDEFDGFIFVSPEYNRSFPGLIKNALDVGSRPYGASKWAGKPAAVATASPGTYGGFGSAQHLRQVLTFLDMPMLQQPEMYLANVHESLKEDGKFQDNTVQYIKGFVDKYIEHMKKYI